MDEIISSIPAKGCRFPLQLIGWSMSFTLGLLFPFLSELPCDSLTQCFNAHFSK